MKVPPGYQVQQGGASSEGNYKGGEGWFFSPSPGPTKFYPTQATACAAAWAEYYEDERRDRIESIFKPSHY